MNNNDLFTKILEEAGKAIQAEMRRLLIQPHRNKNGKTYPMKKGPLYNSIKVEVAKNVLEIIALDYAEEVDKGAKPGERFVKIDALVKWLKWNGIKGRGQGGRFISHIQLAYLIQRAILKRGLNPRNFISPAMAMGQELVNQLLEINGQEIFEQELNKIL